MMQHFEEAPSVEQSGQAVVIGQLQEFRVPLAEG